MAHQIDRAMLWLFAALSAFLLMLTLTNGRIFLSVTGAFSLTFALRLLVSKIPDRQNIRRRERMRFITGLFRKWALAPEDAVLHELKALLPDLLAEDEWKCVRLIQRWPDGEPISANHLLELWKSAPPTQKLILISTCSADANAHTLLSELTPPAIQLIDAAALSKRLYKTIRIFQTADIKRERRAPLSVRVAQWIQQIRPLRTCLYLVLFLLLSYTNRSAIYLIASLSLAGLLALYWLEKYA